MEHQEGSVHAPARNLVAETNEPFRLNVSVGIQDILLIMVSCVCLGIFLFPMILGGLQHVKWARSLSRFIYKRYNLWLAVLIFTCWSLVGFTVLICPDWNMNQYIMHLVDFVWWWAKHLPKFIVSIGTLLLLVIAWNYGTKIMHQFGFDSADFMRFPSLFAKEQVPIELFIWKVGDLESGGFKSNDIYVEVGLGDNQLQTTRVQHNVGNRAMIKQSLQLNFARDSRAMLTLSVCDQQLVAGKEIARISLSPQEVEDLCTSSSEMWGYSEEHFIKLEMKPTGTIWVRCEYVTDEHVHAFETNVRESGFFQDPKVPSLEQPLDMFEEE